jgi:DNA-binding NarL/FixJ family response regulator
VQLADWIGLLEASYDVGADEAAWTRNVLERAAPLFARRLALVLLLVRVTPTTFRVEHGDALGPPEILAHARAVNTDAPPEAIDFCYRSGTLVSSLSATLFGGSPRSRDHFLAASDGLVQDAAGVACHTGTGGVAMFSTVLDRPFSISALERRLWTRAAPHVAAGLRLRRALGGSDLPGARIEAILEPGGRLRDAVGGAEPRERREILREAVRATERARSSAGRLEPERSLERWPGLVDGRWSLVDRFESDGKRFVVAVKNDPEHPDPRGLTLRERQVSEFVGLGRSTKEIAYTLGLAVSTVTASASAAMRKLGFRSRAELAGFFALTGARARLAEVALDGERFLVGSHPLVDETALAPLSDAEREVAAAIVAGSTNADIAARRGTSERTIANQVSAILRKTGAGSRSELAVRLQARDPDRDTAN